MVSFQLRLLSARNPGGQKGRRGGLFQIHVQILMKIPVQILMKIPVQILMKILVQILTHIYTYKRILAEFVDAKKGGIVASIKLISRI